jgi:hypothetical protein
MRSESLFALCQILPMLEVAITCRYALLKRNMQVVADRVVIFGNQILKCLVVLIYAWLY